MKKYGKEVWREKEGERPGGCQGSLTVEAACLMPLVGLILVSSILLYFYFHDKNIISSCAYETAVVGSTKAREKEGVEASLLNQAFSGTDTWEMYLLSGGQRGYPGGRG